MCASSQTRPRAFAPPIRLLSITPQKPWPSSRCTWATTRSTFPRARPSPSCALTVAPCSAPNACATCSMMGWSPPKLLCRGCRSRWGRTRSLGETWCAPLTPCVPVLAQPGSLAGPSTPCSASCTPARCTISPSTRRGAATPARSRWPRAANRICLSCTRSAPKHTAALRRRSVRTS